MLALLARGEAYFTYNFVERAALEELSFDCELSLHGAASLRQLCFADRALSASALIAVAHLECARVRSSARLRLVRIDRDTVEPPTQRVGSLGRSHRVIKFETWMELSTFF